MRRLLFLGLTVFIALPLPALRLTPLPEVTGRPAGADLALDDLIDLALVLSGAPSSAVPGYRERMAQWVGEVQAQTASIEDEETKAEAVLMALHGRLKAYSLYQTRLDVLADRGLYNCVSSALAYMILGRGVGLDIQAVATSDHAFALVRLADGKEIDVETTTRHGFDPGTKNEFTNAFGQTGFVYVPPGNYNHRRTIGDRQLLGLLVQNRMADFQRAGRPDEAVGPAIDRWTLEGTPEAFTTLIEGFVNYGSWLNGRRDYAKGLALVEQMALWTGPAAETKNLAQAFVNNQINVLLDRQDFAGAQALTQDWKDRGFLAEAENRRNLEVIADRQLTAAAKALPWSQAADRVNQAWSQTLVSAARRQELLTYVYGQEVQRTAAARGALAAWTFLGTLPAEVQSWATLAKARDLYAHNAAVEAHNRFAQLWNDGSRDQARQVLEAALAIFPDNALLKKDLAMSGAP